MKAKCHTYRGSKAERHHFPKNVAEKSAGVGSGRKVIQREIIHDKCLCGRRSR